MKTPATESLLKKVPRTRNFKYVHVFNVYVYMSIYAYVLCRLISMRKISRKKTDFQQRVRSSPPEVLP